MTPDDELRAAAAHLRAATFRGAMTATPAVASLLRAREPLADWLTVEAETWAGDEVHSRCTPQTCTLDAALAVARALLGTQDNGSNR